MEGHVLFCCRLSVGQIDHTNTLTQNPISTYKVLGFRWFKEIQNKLRVITGDPRAGNILQTCMSDHTPTIQKGIWVKPDQTVCVLQPNKDVQRRSSRSNVHMTCIQESLRNFVMKCLFF